jgi:monoamine oxidase
MDSESVVVVVVGAGLSGLAAANALVEAGCAGVRVLEASDRVGGRTLSHQLGSGQVVDAGAQWVGRGHTRMLALASELGVDTLPTYDEGRNVLVFRGKRKTYLGDLPPVGTFALLDFAWAKWLIDGMVRELRQPSPWEHARAAEWDALTLGAWLESHSSTAGARFLFEAIVGPNFGCRPCDLSLLAFLIHAQAAGGLLALATVRDGALEMRLDGGSQEISLRLARKLGSRVCLGRPVRRITRSERGAVVEAEGVRVEARRVIVATDPVASRKIDFVPPLPLDRNVLTHRWASAKGVKIHVSYRRPFWRDDGLSGQALGDEGVVRIVFDSSPSDGASGVLTGFTGAVVADAALFEESSREQRRRLVLESLARYFGPPALAPVDYFEKDWSNEPFIEGCVSHPPPGLLSGFGPALQRCVDVIHFAGSEAADEWNDFMEGAVRSGERAAREVLAAI